MGYSIVIVPPETNYISISLTFRCPLNCPYCINDYTAGVKINEADNEVPGDMWVKALNRLQIPKNVPLTLEGGEPSLHSGFYEIIDGVKNKINILTNLCFDVDEFIDMVDTRKIMHGCDRAFKPIRISYHALTMDMMETVGKAELLQEAGFGVGIFGLSHPEHVEQNIKMAEECRKRRLYFYIKDFLGYYQGKLFGHFRYPDSLDGSKLECHCSSNELLIGPNGDIYKCHRDMYAGELPLSSIFDSDLVIEHKSRPCYLYGKCNPCDVKFKTNRYLKAGNSSVEILR